MLFQSFENVLFILVSLLALGVLGTLAFIVLVLFKVTFGV